MPQPNLKNRLKASLPGIFTDVVFALNAYRLAHGEYPRLIRPRTFNEMILRRMMFDRRALLATFADKMEARQFVARRVGPQVLPQLHLVTKDPDDIDYDALPQRFVIKASHGSGWVRIVLDKSCLNRRELTETCRRWLGANYYDVARERAYRKIRPQIMVEEFLDDGSGSPPNDYKFFVFGGSVALIHIVGGRFASRRQSYYDANWQDTGMKVQIQRFEHPLPKPKNLDAMLTMARRLAEGVEFVRVDLYDLGTRVCFGEMTATPGAGLSPFEPRSMDERLGQLWKSARR